jgi:hypothetical protein
MLAGLRWRSWFKQSALLLALTLLAVLVHGYHLGLEDQAIYLPAIKKNLNPALYPQGAEFFLAQTRATIFGELVAVSVRVTHLPLDIVIFLWQVCAIFLILWACLRLSRKLFRASWAQWSGVVMAAVMLTLPVTGTGLYIVDQYLHPRALATALLLFMLGEVFLPPSGDRKFLRAACWIIPAALLHVQMASYGALLAVFFLLPGRWFAGKFNFKGQEQGAIASLLLPIFSLMRRPSAAWLEAARTRHIHYLLQWRWYEWLGIFAPLALLAWFSKLESCPGGENPGDPQLSDVCRRLVGFGAFIFLVAAMVTMPPGFERLTPFQPMRGYHLLYVFFVLIVGGLAGQFILQRHSWRWLVLYVPLSLAMFYVQRQLLPSSPHIELPGAAPRNPWLKAFAWIKNTQNTPIDAYFALDPHYLELPQEDEHGFRALGERSMMADYVKDSGVVLLFPPLADEWQREVRARDGWERFQAGDFRRLRDTFGVTWVVLEDSNAALAASELTCPYKNELVRVCRID